MSVGFRIFNKINRPDKALVAQFEGLPVANIGDEMNRFACMDAGIRPLNHAPMLGTAFTVRARAGDNLVLNRAIDMAEAGDIIVVDAGGESTNALIGENMIMWAERRGIAGLIVDGAVRDLGSIREMTFPCYARHIQPNGPYKNGPGEINVPVSCGRQIVHPGDIIVGDADGVIVISPADAEQVLDRARAKLKKEIATREAIVAGTWDRSLYTPEALEAMGCEIIDDSCSARL
ncbi:RraA family protein [Microvirga aerophila]|uniref:Putative 4-hydroxy-4-methyl-2-oxoglutarate aldolase n=1 Tax=Microvirga aerophila TaxID=670291 RepID=A0A512BW20_9HYPH|nr:RraA family protein [Microvirga aerophila]GEO16125.1 methyltransferase [Microvirga aerophila]